MASTKSEQGLVKILTGAVLLTGGLVALSLLATNPDEADPSSIAAIARAPANLVGMAISVDRPAVPLLERTSVLNFDCTLPTTAEVSPDIRQLRISGRQCEFSDVLETEIMNLTNGFSATVFGLKTHHFTSDYIHLAEGDNRLRLTYVRDSGERINREFSIVRQAGASTPSK